MTLYQKLRVWYYTHRKPRREKLNIETLMECHRIIESRKLMPDPKPQAPLPMTTGPLEPPTPKPSK